jgi:hypothetical protein
VRSRDKFEWTITGGDASESYILKAEFDSIHILNMTISSGENPDAPLEERTYHIRRVGD